MTLFERIINREIPAGILYEDELCVAINDVNPQAPIHILVIPKKAILSANEISDEDEAILAKIFAVLRRLAKEKGIAETGYRIVNNCGGNGGQSVPHLHFHLLGGRQMSWPPG